MKTTIIFAAAAAFCAVVLAVCVFFPFSRPAGTPDASASDRDSYVIAASGKFSQASSPPSVFDGKPADLELFNLTDAL